MDTCFLSFQRTAGGTDARERLLSNNSPELFCQDYHLHFSYLFIYMYSSFSLSNIQNADPIMGE